MESVKEEFLHLEISQSTLETWMHTEKIFSEPNHSLKDTETFVI